MTNLDSNPNGESKFLVACDSCSFERTVQGREAATRVGDRHRRRTGHEIVALEMPRTERADRVV